MSGKYGFSINLEGNSAAQLAKITAALKTMGSTADKETETAKRDIDSLSESFEHAKHQFMELFAVEKIVEWGKELLNVTAEFEAFDNVIKFSSLNTIDAQENLSFLHDTIDRLHLPMKQAYEGFSEMEAGLAGTNIQGEKLRKFFEGFSTMATVQNLSQFKYDLSLLDLKEIGETGLNKRMEKSLTRNLPGIKKVVMETFGKSMDKLQEEHMGGGEFLEKLGAGMEKSFAPGVANALNSLQANINATSNKMTETMIEMGDNLKPVFIDIMHTIQGAFDSAPVRFFIDNIKDIVKVVSFAAETWMVYKGALIATDIITKMFIIDEGILSVEMGSFTLMTDGAIWAVEGLGAALETIGWGLVAGGIALIVNNLMDVNKEINDAIEGMTKFKQFEDKGKTITTAFDQGQLNMQEFQQGNLSDQEKSEAYSKTKQDFETTSKYVRDLSVQMSNAQKSIDSEALRLYADKEALQSGNPEKTRRDILAAGVVPAGGTNYQDEEANKKMEELKNAFNTASGQLNKLSQDKWAYEHAGVKPPAYSTYSDDGGKGHAKHLQDLSGGHGGLGEAKTIQIIFNAPLQQNTGVKESATKSDDAVRILLEAIQNLYYSQSAAI